MVRSNLRDKLPDHDWVKAAKTLALVLISLMLLAGGAISQETAAQIKAKHDAYFLCLNNIETKPREAFSFCSTYLKAYPNDDPRLIEFAGMFTTAFSKIDFYLKSISPNDFSDSVKWSIYLPDLKKAIPWTDDREGKHKIEISREFGSPNEEKLLAKAEAVYTRRQDMESALFKQWRYYAQPSVELPTQEPKWWAGSFDSVLSAETVTASAVLYYYDLSMLLRSNDDKVKENSFKFISTDLKYSSSIKRVAVYKRSGKSFNDVYVADMTLSWGQVCGGLCGAGFTRNKVVVLRSDGEISDVFLDDPVNRSNWVS